MHYAVVSADSCQIFRVVPAGQSTRRLQESADVARPVNVIGIDSLQCGMIESCNSIFAHGCTQLLAELCCLSRIFQSDCALLYQSNDKREVPLGNSMCL